MASWCVATGMPPEVFNSLSRIERDAFIEALIQRNKQQ